MAEDFETEIRNRVSKIFHENVAPLIEELITEFNGLDGIEAKTVSDIPVIMGIKEFSSILFKLPTGVEHVVCVYWIDGEQQIVAENIRMVTVNRSFDIFDLNTDELKKTIKVLAGLGRYE
ncbi:MAG: hypothetical protein GWO07_12375 [Candidatus Dadabacteria bacterium]|nr:hypothetical protein [Candidatus Dadabacteria bacterium]NIS09532.1 hypothetical protein [Candidatus Dadabacteria bacterium]NIV42744.1 hypothetical protein [Candidatus Dadabacteria bacterium]NIX16638.1 hypothetical protein [Candidatus Dadabacteria bacterium]NIY23179.1 hypothetical protein [Candidatus Dadabacteria bacterium]